MWVTNFFHGDHTAEVSEVFGYYYYYYYYYYTLGSIDPEG